MFKKGVSGNPGGHRNLAPPFTMGQLKQHWSYICAILDSKKTTDREKLDVLKWLFPLEIAHLCGKPLDKVEVSGPEGSAITINIPIMKMPETEKSE